MKEIERLKKMCDIECNRHNTKSLQNFIQQELAFSDVKYWLRIVFVNSDEAQVTLWQSTFKYENVACETNSFL